MDREVQPESRSVVRARDEGLRLLTRLRRWLVFASVVLAGALAALVAQAKPGKSSSAAASSSPQLTHRPGSSSRASGASSGRSATGSPPAAPISPPAQAPAAVAPVTPSAPAVSGGS